MTNPARIRDAEKKAEERYYVEILRSKCPDFPEGSIQDSEAPDFLVDSASGVIGIEVRRFFVPSTDKHSLQANESLQEQVVQGAERIHRSRGGPPLGVVISFDDNFRLTKRRVPSLAEALATLVLSRTPTNLHAQTCIEHEWFSAKDPVPEEVDEIGVVRDPGLTRGSWSTVGGGCYIEVAPSRVQAEIDEKTPRYAACRKRSDQDRYFYTYTAPRAALEGVESESSLLGVQKSLNELGVRSQGERWRPVCITLRGMAEH